MTECRHFLLRARYTRYVRCPDCGDLAPDYSVGFRGCLHGYHDESRIAWVEERDNQGRRWGRRQCRDCGQWDVAVGQNPLYVPPPSPARRVIAAPLRTANDTDDIHSIADLAVDLTGSPIPVAR